MTASPSLAAPEPADRAPAMTHLPPGRIARLGLACIGAVTIGFIVLCLVVLVQARRDATDAADTQARNIAASVAQDVARNFDLYDLSLQAVVRGLRWPGIMTLDPTLRQTILFAPPSRAPYFGFINALNAAGTVVADSQSVTPRGGNFASRDYFIAQRNDARDLLFIGRPFLTGPGQPATIPISRRISNPDGSFAGVVVGSMRLAYFLDLFSRLNVGAHGSIALLRSDGLVLMRRPFHADDIGRTLPADSPFFHVADGGQAAGIDAIDHLRRRFLLQPIGTLPLTVAVGLADADIYAAWHTRAVALGVAIGALSTIDLLLLLVVRYALISREAGLATLRAAEAQRAALIGQREHAVAAMEQTAAAKTRFVAAMSHELRTPLNSLLGYAELLAMDGGMGPVQAGRLTAMRSAGEHLRSVIDKVLDFGRVESQASQTPPACTDLHALMADCLSMVHPIAAAKGLALSNDVAAELPRHIMADAAAIRQVLLNLLGNAVKFTNRGAVALRAVPCPAGLRFVVADTGIGIPASQHGRLFQPYERLGADRMGVSGAGLGLAITAGLVARMGGRIGHDANRAGGSVFWVELPLREASAAPPEPAIEPPAATRSLRILVVDDSAMNRDITEGLLRTAGHVVSQADNGEAALRLVAAQDFDVVLMDLRMPVVDGMTAVRQIRAMPGPRGQTPVIAVTAQVMDDEGAALLAAGFQGLLIKPIERVSLLASVAAAAEPQADEPPSPPEDTEMTQGHQAIMSDQLTRLLRMLENPAAEPGLGDMVHRIAGDAAQLGYSGLAMAARRHEAESPPQGGTPRPETVAMLRDMVETTLGSLCQESP
jgi:signal transduction histidine kinase/DNA-binding NarL/FixJ family response regulator